MDCCTDVAVRMGHRVIDEFGIGKLYLPNSDAFAELLIDEVGAVV